jgi:hypothetical protein
MKKVVVCDICNNWISKANLARHMKRHGTVPCVRCTRNGIKYSNFNSTDYGTHIWFTAFQYDILTDELLYTVKQLMQDDGCSNFSLINRENLHSYFIAAVFILEYFWLLSEPLHTHIFELMYRKTVLK